MEKNPSNLTLFYGNQSQNIDLVNDCFLKNAGADSQYICDKFVNLNNYDGGKIEYYFVLEDKVGNKDESNHKKLSVDTTFPVVNNQNSFYSVNGKFVFFSLSITENNFDEVTFSYTDTSGRNIERKICSRLNNAGYCERNISFRPGSYNLTVNIIDQASNKLALPANFVIA